jgi:hypothetical protein
MRIIMNAHVAKALAEEALRLCAQGLRERSALLPDRDGDRNRKRRNLRQTMRRRFVIQSRLQRSGRYQTQAGWRRRTPSQSRRAWQQLCRL